MQGHRLGKSSRREFIRGSAALALTGPGFMSLGRPVLAYVGTYSSPQGPEGAIGRGQGIYLFEMNAATGLCDNATSFLVTRTRPGWLSILPERTCIQRTRSPITRAPTPALSAPIRLIGQRGVSRY
jgi:hypothetical protein